MSFDDENEYFGDEPEAGGGNGDEQSNRTFKYAMIGLVAVGALGVLVLALALLGKQGQRNDQIAYNQSVQATNAAIAELSLITPSPVPTETPVPTSTSAPTATPRPSPTKPPTSTATPAPTLASGETVTNTSSGGSTTGGANSGGSTAGGATLAPTRLSPQSATATAASKNITNTLGSKATSQPASGTVPETGVGDYAWLLLAAGLVAILFIARRMRTVQS